MDVFIEQMVKHKKGAKDILLCIAAVIAALILSLFFLLTFVFNKSMAFFSGVGMLLAVGCWYGAYIVIKFTNVEYEYILTNHYFDIDKILGKSKRKHVVSLDFKEIMLCAPANSEAAADVRGVKKEFNCCGDGKLTTYALFYESDKGLTKVLFEPSEKIMKAAYVYNPSKIIVE